MTDKREFKESPMEIGPNEEIAFDLTVSTSWGSSPSSPTCTLEQGGVDVSSDYLSGSASASGQVITTQLISGLTAGKRYLLTVQWTAEGNTLNAWGWVDCK